MFRLTKHAAAFAAVTAATAPLVTQAEMDAANACTQDDWKRYTIVVCSETMQDCHSKLPWCEKWVNEWKKYFGACNRHECDWVHPDANAGASEGAVATVTVEEGKGEAESVTPPPASEPEGAHDEGDGFDDFFGEDMHDDAFG